MAHVTDKSRLAAGKPTYNEQQQIDAQARRVQRLLKVYLEEQARVDGATCKLEAMVEGVDPGDEAVRIVERARRYVKDHRASE